MDIRANGLLAMVDQLSAKGQYATALAAVELFLTEAPQDLALLNLAGSVAYQAKHYARALSVAEQLEQLGAADAVVRSHKARCLNYLRRAPEAVAVMRTIVAEHPQDPDYRILLAQFLQQAGHFDESYALLQTVPESMSGWHMLMGWHRIRLGDFLGGFRLFAHENGMVQLDKKLGLPQEKRIRKDTDVSGKTVLFLLEGGFGDEILFTRFIPRLEARGARVVMGGSQRLKEVMRRNRYVTEWRDAMAVSANDFDYYMCAVDSIDFFEVRDPIEGFEFPYLSADPVEVARWQPIIEQYASDRKKIGIHWQGNLEFDYADPKSVPAELMLRFAPLGALFSLQREAGDNTLPPGAPAFDAEAGPPSWPSTAAVIAQMDYVVTNDTSTAHLAGALGKKTLVLLPHAPHIYWIADKNKSILYPNMPTFRQPSYGDWAGAVDAATAHMRDHEQ